MAFVRRAYSEDEITQIYELARLMIESGQLKKAEAIFNGVNEVAPDFCPGWLGSCYLHFLKEDYESATSCAKRAHESDSDNVEAMLYLVICYLATGDKHAAGTYLGEINERAEQGRVESSDAMRLFKMQLARFQSR